MATQQRPKGSRARLTPDWFTDRAATVGAWARATSTNGVQISLFNNATDGSYLHVWTTSIYTDGEGPCFASQLQGSQGTFLQNAVPVVFNVGALPGQIFWNIVPGIPNQPNDSALSDSAYFGEEAATDIFWRCPGPHAIVAPQYSYAITNNQGGGVANGAILAVTFYYLALQGSPV